MEAYKKNKVHQISLSGDTVINLPVAPMVLYRTRFAGNEDGKVQAMLPQEVLEYIGSQGNVSRDSAFVVAVTGPGDPLATPNETVDVVKQIQQQYPGARFALRTMGVGGADLADPLAKAGVDYVELIANGFTVEALQSTYVWIRPGRKTLPLKKAGKLLIEQQQEAIQAFKANDMTVCGNIDWFGESDPGQFSHSCKTLKDLGADFISLTIHGKGSSSVTRKDLVVRAEEFLPVVDALPDWRSSVSSCGNPSESADVHLPKPSKQRPNVAVASGNGMDVDLHLGHAKQILVYGPREDGLACLLETRQSPPSGGGELRWHQLAEILSDCFVLLAASAGDKPRKVLADHGIRVLVVNDGIEGCVDVLYGGGKKKKCKK